MVSVCVFVYKGANSAHRPPFSGSGADKCHDGRTTGCKADTGSNIPAAPFQFGHSNRDVRQMVVGADKPFQH